MRTLFKSLAAIPDRTAFIQRAEAVGLSCDRCAALIVDVAGFSDVSTSMSLASGDRLLLQIANRLSSLFDNVAAFGRLNGDVFAIMFTSGTTSGAMRRRAEALNAHFSTPVSYAEHTFIAEFHIGAVVGRQRRFCVSAFITQGENALRQAKKNRYERFAIASGSSPDFATGQRVALKADLHRAISQHELALYFQPKVNLQTLEIVGAECLLRWDHPVDGIILPGPIIEAAQSYQMMRELAYWTLQQACCALSYLAKQNIFIPLSINISPTQLYDSQLIPQIQTLCNDFALDPSRLELELTEDVALSNSAMVTEQITKLRQIGVGVAIDDFGKGYSNLTAIRDLPISSLKVDKAFVLQLHRDPMNEAILQAACLIGNAKGCEVVAEGIESVAHLHILRRLNVVKGQGFLFSKAVPFRDFIALYHQEIIIGSSPLRQKLTQ
ncbi:EAL domain-containing protein [Salinimonas sp. HHU 13199]|uniref:EAL domain-containing protein n=1 Tax=Salinimonas profundi TaxID=2729140 RepID=A0ABR8LIM3_9ALTE|nr:GGDEF domain-containing phosphodiesterase [Salinimonas profundi]MBD3584931.1 EAL domain-containing protein [Salinimonas profundi]